MRRVLDRSINGLDAAGAASAQRAGRATASVADAGTPPRPSIARRAALRAALQPQVARYAVLGERADAILHRHVFAESEQLLGFLWDLFRGPVWDQAQAAVAQMNASERAVFISLHELLQQTERLAGEDGLALLLGSYSDRYLTTDGQLSDALVGVLTGLGRA